jgi:hypothetical protein
MTSDLDKLCSVHNILVACEPTTRDDDSDWGRSARHFKVRLTRRVDGSRRQLTTVFSQGSAHTSEPSPADVLSCLIGDAFYGRQSFDDFCSDLGYDNDSRRAERTWRACKATAPKVDRFLGDDLEAFESAEH